jgi:polar amino acid transport system permease protein
MDIELAPLLLRWQFLSSAILITIELSVLSMVVGLAIGTVVGTLRTYGSRLTDSFPLVIGHSIGTMTAGVIGLGVHLGAYVAETIRAGLTSVRKGQMQAALALGMSRFEAIRKIILPQAIVRMLPSLGSLLTFAIKDSAVASVIAVPELMRQSQIVAGQTYHFKEIYTAAMIVYFLLCYPVAHGVDRVYRRVAHLGSS